MEDLELALNRRLNLGEAFVKNVKQSRADLERQLVERDEEFERKICETTVRLQNGLGRLQTSAEDLQVKLLEQDIQQLESEANSIDSAYNTVDDQCQLFEDLLKIKLLKVKDNDLQFVMSDIDGSDPEQVFIFTLRPEENGSYTVFDQDPDLPNFKQLVDELNRSKDVGQFVRRVRRGWEQLQV